MTKTQQVKTFAKANGLTIKFCRATSTVSVCGRIVWDGRTHKGWADVFDNYDQVYDFFFACTQSGDYPWRRA